MTGEHGVGVEKLGPMCSQFGAAELADLPRAEARIRSGGPAQSRQGRAHARPLRRLRRAARARRPAAAFAPAAVLTDMALIETPPGQDLTDALVERVRAASHASTPLRIVGGDTKRFYGRPVAGETLATGRSSRRPALRSGRTRDHRARRHAARRHRGAACAARATTAVRAAVLRLVGHARRHGRRWTRRSRARRAGSGARLRARRAAADRRRPRAQVRRRSHEERRRLRRLAPARRVARHPRRAARRVAQGAAGRPRHPDAAAAHRRARRDRPARRGRSTRPAAHRQFLEHRRTATSAWKAPRRAWTNSCRRSAATCWTSRQPPRSGTACANRPTRTSPRRTRSGDSRCRRRRRALRWLAADRVAFEWNGAQAWLSGVERQAIDLITPRQRAVMPPSSVATTPQTA